MHASVTLRCSRPFFFNTVTVILNIITTIFITSSYYNGSDIQFKAILVSNYYDLLSQRQSLKKNCSVS